MAVFFVQILPCVWGSHEDMEMKMSEETVVPEVPEAPAENEPVQNIEATATPEPVVETTEEVPKEAPKPGKNSFDRKIDRLYRDRAEQKARADLLERQLEELKPKAQTIQGAPRIEDFNDIDEYANAKAKFEAENILKSHQASLQAENNKRQLQSLASSWEEKSTRADGKYDDFDEVVGDLKPVNALTIAIMQAENAEDVAYYLGKNLKEAQRLAGLDPIAQIREIGRLEAKLLSDPPKPKTPSQAPAPISPLSGKSAVNNGEPLDTDDMKTWLKKRNKQVRG